LVHRYPSGHVLHPQLQDDVALICRAIDCGHCRSVGPLVGRSDHGYRCDPPDLTPEECAEIVRLVRAAIDGERYVLSPRVKRLKSILAKLDPAPSATVAPYPAPRPSA